MREEIKYSIVVPLYNEEANVTPLYVRMTQVMSGLEEPYEIVLVDDGSTDGTAAELAEITMHDSRVTVIRLSRNFGQTAALQAGFDFARGDVIVSLDGDLQHDPAEIPEFIGKINEGYDLVSGWRVKRNDTWLTRRLPSRIANRIMSQLSRVDIHDFGTTFKAYRSQILHNLRLYSDHHRFIPALASWSGARIAEIPIKNIPRQNGKSNYGITRTTRVLLDLISIKFLLDYSSRPSQLFGMLGLASSGLGILTGMVLLAKKMIFHAGIMGPALIVALLLILAGIQFLSLGLLGEMITRTYYESQSKATYNIRQILNRSAHQNLSDLAVVERVPQRAG
jgi:glycosyltransferase involved in cell wall biosynthesis